MPRTHDTIAIVALAASIGLAGIAAPALAKETRDERVVRDDRPTNRMAQPRTGHQARIDAMKQASARVTRTSMVPGSDSAGDHDALQTFAVATGLYGR